MSEGESAVEAVSHFCVCVRVSVIASSPSPYKAVLDSISSLNQKRRESARSHHRVQRNDGGEQQARQWCVIGGGGTVVRGSDE